MHAVYWQTVDSVRAISNAETVTSCTGSELAKSVAPIWKVPPGIGTQSIATLSEGQSQVGPVHP